MREGERGREREREREGERERELAGVAQITDGGWATDENNRGCVKERESARRRMNEGQGARRGNGRL